MNPSGPTTPEVPVWDPQTYLAYADERSRPFADLLARVPAIDPRAVLDLGCCPGQLPAALATRWPRARVTGVDSSVAMVEQARTLDAPVAFEVGDLRGHRPAADTDVLVCHATLQWVPDHDDVLRGWVRDLPAGGWLAVQVPGNFDAPSHRALRSLARSPRWSSQLADLVRDAPVHPPAGYADLLQAAGCTVDAWETTYLHGLTADGDRHPVLSWMSGTALRPVRQALDDADWDAFTAELDDALAAAYPVQESRCWFPFRRVFVVARTPDRARG